MEIYILAFASYFISLYPCFIDTGIDDITAYTMKIYLFITITLLKNMINL